MSWLTDLFTNKPKEDWRLVKTITMKCRVGEEHPNEKVYYHLFESDRGNRRVEIKGTANAVASSNWEIFKESNDTYQETIYPWVNGRMNTDIPTYGDVPKQEMLDYLKK